MYLNKTRRKIVAGLALLVIVVLACFFSLRQEERRLQRHGSSHARGYTHGDMGVLFAAITDFAIDNAAFFDDAVTNAAFDPSRFEIMTKLHAAVLEHGGDSLASRMLSTGKLLDTWGHEFHLKIIRVAAVTNRQGMVSRSYEIKIWSNGPNGVDNNGEGDDLLFNPRTFEIFE